jgi:hypothetical protein
VYCHTSGSVNWPRVEYKNITGHGVAALLSWANVDVMVCTGTFKGYQISRLFAPATASEWFFENARALIRTNIVGANLGNTGGNGDRFTITGEIDAEFNTTGYFGVVYTGCHGTIANWTMRGAVKVLRIQQSNVTIDVRRITNRPNSNLTNQQLFEVTTTGLTGLSFKCDFNDWGSNSLGARVTAAAGAVATSCSTTNASTTVTLGGVTGYVARDDAISGTNIPASARIVRQLTGTTPGGAGDYEIFPAASGTGSGLTLTISSTTMRVSSVLRGSVDFTQVGREISGTGVTATTILSPSGPFGHPVLAAARQFASTEVLIGTEQTVTWGSTTYTNREAFVAAMQAAGTPVDVNSTS